VRALAVGERGLAAGELVTVLAFDVERGMHGVRIQGRWLRRVQRGPIGPRSR
jgi:hypothetical protein